MAINNALTVLSWFENLQEDEQPPRHIWFSDELIGEWFEDVKAKRNSKFNKRRSSYDEAEDVPMSENEYAAQYRQAMGIG